MSRNSGYKGGAAAIGGFAFQNSIAAWIATGILGEQAVSPHWGLPADVYYTFIRCETEQPVDDILVGTSDDRLIFIQVKRSLCLTDRADSELASALDQFVRQFHFHPKQGDLAWNRQMDLSKDRLVLATDANAPSWAKVELPNLLQRVRTESDLTDVCKLTLNQAEEKVLRTVVGHVNRSWQEQTGSEPSTEELKQLLSVIWVDCFDFGRGRRDELPSIDLLKTRVVQVAAQAEPAFRVIERFCENLAQTRSGTDLAGLQKELLHNRIGLKEPFSYESDIKRLSQYARDTLENIHHLAVTRVNQTEIKIDRPCIGELLRAARKGHCLVIGEPGSGKSGVLYYLAEELTKLKNDIVFLSADHVESGSLSNLQQELQLEHGIVDILEKWPSLSDGYVVLDALDAARSGDSANMLTTLIRRVIQLNGRWKVIATIRKFDLRYQREIQELFTGDPVALPEPDKEFEKVRHLNVPRLTESELEQIQGQSSNLWNLLKAAKFYEDQTFYKLLHEPFNLRIAASLITEGTTIQELTPIRSQIGLLDKYWIERVIDSKKDNQGHAREAVIRMICQIMIDKQSLRVNMQDADPLRNAALLTDLLSKNVLVEWKGSTQGMTNRNVLAFSHHVLFDYSVERMLLSGSSKEIAEFITPRPFVVLSTRPSFVLHFRRLWLNFNNHTDFWNLTIELILDRRIQKIGQVVGPSVAVEMACCLEDFRRLFGALTSEENAVRGAAEEAIEHIVGTLLAKKEPLRGGESGPWCEFVAEVSKCLSPSTAGCVRTMLNNITDQPAALTECQVGLAGLAARNLTDFALQSKDPGIKQWLFPVALTSVCKTFASDEKSSAQLIRRYLKCKNLQDVSYVKNAWWLAREIRNIFKHDPKLVALIYLVILNSDKPADKLTSMYDSKILHLTSTLKQDFEMAQRQLAEVFPHFLESSPFYAVRVLLRVIKHYVRTRHEHAKSDVIYTFDFGKQIACFVADVSCVWDQGNIYQHDPPVMMLNAFSSYLDRLASSPRELEHISTVVDLVVKHNRTAVIWRRVLQAGAKHPNTIGKYLVPLLKVPLLLVTPDSCTESGNMLHAVHPLLNASEKEEIEELVLGLPELKQLEKFSYLERHRARLLGCIPDESMILPEAKKLLQELKDGSQVPANEPPVRFKSSRGEYTREKWWQDLGVQIDTQPNVNFRNVLRPVSEFTKKFINGVPNLEDASRIMRSLRELYVALGQVKENGVEEEIAISGIGDLTEGCAILARNDDLLQQQDVTSFITTVFLDASKHSCPEYDTERNEQFDRMPSWGSSSPRVNAAEGLMLIARNANALTDEVRDAIKCLSDDKVYAVRYMVGRRLGLLSSTDPNLMWDLIEKFSKHDTSFSILHALVSDVLYGLTGKYADRTIPITKSIFDRTKPIQGCTDPQEACVSLFVGAFIHLNNSESEKILLDLIQNVSLYHHQLAHIGGMLRDWLGNWEEEPSEERQAACSRAWRLMDTLCESSVKSWHELEDRYGQTTSSQIPEEVTTQWQELGRLIDSLATDIFFASGAHEEKHKSHPPEREHLSKKQKDTFLQNAKKCLDLLQTVGIPSIAHHLVETLQAYIEIAPEQVFHRVGQIVVAAQAGGYQYESLAADLIVEVIGHYLARYKWIFRDSPDCQELLVRILDIFVMWPNARKLTYKLEDIYR